MRIARLPAALLLVLVCLHESEAASSSSSIYFCRCACFDQVRVIPLYRPADPSKPCLSCTKSFCIDQKLAICDGASLGNTDPDTGTGEEGDVSAKCFQRDSALAKLSVISFILLVSGLLVGACAKDRLRDSALGQRVDSLTARYRRRQGSYSVVQS